MVYRWRYSLEEVRVGALDARLLLLFRLRASRLTFLLGPWLASYIPIRPQEAAAVRNNCSALFSNLYVRLLLSTTASLIVSILSSGVVITNYQ